MKYLDNIIALKYLSIIFVLLTLVGVFINYSSVPQADMWSNFELIYEFKNKNYQYLFSQHNEHRILIPRLIYLLDYYIFNDGYYLLYFLNSLLFFFIFYFLNLCFRENYFAKQYDSSWYFFTISILFFWGQKSNFIWAYQSQFLLAYLFPLLSIYFISKINVNHYLYLLLSVVFALLAIGTMANGLFVLPILFLYLIFNNRLYESLLILFIGVISFIFYFYNFSVVTNHADLSNIFSRLDSIIIFYFVLSGNFFSFMVGKGSFGLIFAGLIGFILNALLIFLSIKNFKELKKEYLIYILLFIIISLFSIAIGRENLGFKSAISSRYITPVIIFFCISIFYFFKYSFIKPANIKIYFVVILLLLTPYQVTAVKNNNDKNIKDISNLVSFMMGIDNNIPHFDNITQTEYFINKNILIFSQPLIKFAKDTKNENFCDLQKINNFYLSDIKNKNWYQLTINEASLNNDSYKLFNVNGEYMGFIFNTSIVENLIYKNYHYIGFVKIIKDADLYFCKS